MSDGRTHQMITVSLIAPSAVGAFVMSNDVATAVCAACGCTFNIICGPDLDQEGITKNETSLLHSRFWFIGIFWVMIWFPYAFAVKHRSTLSHAPIISTLFRDLYLTAVGAFVLWLVDLMIHAMIPTVQISVLTAVYDWIVTIPPQWIIAFVAAQICADSAHWLTDIISTRKKRNARKRKPTRQRKKQRRNRRLWALRRFGSIR